MKVAFAAVALLAAGCVQGKSQPQHQNAPFSQRGLGGQVYGHAPPPITCPQHTRWDGSACVYRYTVTDVRCPAGAAWDGQACSATHVVCPPGARWTKGRCVADLVNTDGEIIETNPADVANVSDKKDEIFDKGGATPTREKSPFDRR